jgi:predicted dehydrogenase
MTRSLAMIGTGHIAGEHLAGVQALNAAAGSEELRLTALVDALPGRAEAWVARHLTDDSPHRPAVARSAEDLLSGPHRPDLVSILVPHHLHLDLARPFLEAGVAVQLQKPIGLAIRDARAIADLAESTGTPLVVSEPSVLGRQTRLTLEWLRSGRQIGEPVFMIDQAVIDLRGGFFVTPWRHLKGMAGAGWFIDHGVHRTHWMLEAFGPCESAYAQTRRLESHREDEHHGRVDVDTEDLGAAVLRFRSGVVVQWTVMSGGRGEPHAFVGIWGTRGSYRDGRVVLSGSDDFVLPTLDDDAVPSRVPQDPFAHSYQELLALMDDPSADVVGHPRRALEAEAIVYAALESAHTGSEVRVADVVRGDAHDYEETVWAAKDALAGREMPGLT